MDENSISYQIWIKVTMRSKPKFKISLPADKYDYETVRKIAYELKEEFHFAAVSVIKVKDVS
jgi:hypothetical protein